MSGFGDAVRRVLGSTRPGDVLTYGDVAAEAGYPGAARAVGTLMARQGHGLPWWRVVGSGGRIIAPAASEQVLRLRGEGVDVDEDVSPPQVVENRR